MTVLIDVNSITQAFLNGPDKDSVNLEDNSQRRLQATFKGSYDYAVIALYGDLVFLYWPSQIALACLMVASKNNGFTEDLDRYDNRNNKICL